MGKSLTAALIAAFTLSACNNGGQTSENEESAEEDTVEVVADTLHLFEEVAPPVAADELFDDFFFNFASDSKYQNQRICFPLPIKDSGQKIELTKEDWHRYNRFKAQEFYSVIYERERDLELQKDTTINEVSIEWIDLKDEYIEKLNFRRLKGKWMLTDITKEDMAKSPNGSFLKFYAEFVNDSSFQRENLSENLKFVTLSEDEEEGETDILSADEWFAMQSDMPVLTGTLVNIDYGQACISQNRKIILMEGLGSGLSIKFKFDKVGGTHWKLIEIEN